MAGATAVVLLEEATISQWALLFVKRALQKIDCSQRVLSALAVALLTPINAHRATSTSLSTSTRRCQPPHGHVVNEGSALRSARIRARLEGAGLEPGPIGAQNLR